MPRLPQGDRRRSSAVAHASGPQNAIAKLVMLENETPTEYIRRLNATLESHRPPEDPTDSDDGTVFSGSTSDSDDADNHVPGSPLKRQQQPRSPTEAATRAMTIRAKVDALVGCLTPRMREAARRDRETRHITPEMRGAFAAARGHGLDLDQLLDVKAAFDTPDPISGEAGVSEHRFVSIFGPKLAPGQSDEELRFWFRSIDTNTSGTVSWGEISSYLSLLDQAPGADTKRQRNYFFERCVAGFGPTVAKVSHKEVVTRIVPFTPGHALSISTDGIVLVWDLETLRAQRDPIHYSTVPVIDVAYVASSQRVIVLQADSVVFTYGIRRSPGRASRFELQRAFTCSRRLLPDEPTDRPIPYKGGSLLPVPEDEVVDQSTLAARAQRHMRGTRKENPEVPLVPILDMRDDLTTLTAIRSALFEDVVAVGTETGDVIVARLSLSYTVKSAALRRLKSHTAQVTQVRYSSALGLLVSASLDGTCVVSDPESGVTVSRVAPPPEQRHPITGFVLNEGGQLLYTWATRRVYVWHLGTATEVTVLRDHPRHVLGVAHNAAQDHLYALMTDKTVKVWDCRTWKSLGEGADVMFRPRNNRAATIYWSDSHQLLITACCAMFAWRPMAAQERLDFGLDPTDVSASVALMRPLPSELLLSTGATGHVIGIGPDSIVTWAGATLRQLGDWDWRQAEDTVTAAALDAPQVRVLMGTESGRVLWVNYTCGEVIARLMHPAPSPSIAAVLHVPGDGGGGSLPYAIAASGRTLMAWTDENVTSDVAAPLASVAVPFSVSGRPTTLVLFHKERQLILAGTTDGSVLMYAPNLTLFTVVRLPCADVRLVGAFDFGLCVALVDDGTLMTLGYRDSRGDVAVASTFPASSALGVVPTAATVVPDVGILAVGDAAGCISIFSSLQFDHSACRSSVLFQFATSGTAKQQCRDAATVELVVAVRAHEGEITGLERTSGRGRVVSCADDKRFRLWGYSDQRELVLLCDVPGSPALLLRKVPLPVEDVTPTHPFQAWEKEKPSASSVGSQSPETRSRVPSHPPAPAGNDTTALSFAAFIMQNTSAPSTEAPVVSTAQKTDPKADAPNRRRMSIARADPPKPVVATPEPGGAARKSGPVAASAWASSSWDTAPLPPLTSTLLGPDMGVASVARASITPQPHASPTMIAKNFMLTSDRLMRLRPNVHRDVPIALGIRDQLYEIASLQARRGMEPGMAPVAAFAAIKLPPL